MSLGHKVIIGLTQNWIQKRFIIMKYYDPTKKQLIFISEGATPDFWDEHWKIQEDIREKIIKIKNSFVSQITKKYLKPEDGVILEGGCGVGQNVASLFNNGYKCIGIDYAEKTVRMLNQYIPELDIRHGDIRKLKFEDNYFIGYWSLGVIEHYWEGYELIAEEMFRVIKNNGFLFLGFPYMSPIRRLKAQFGFYKFWPNNEPSNFYQFCLNSDLVIRNFKKLGFKMIDVTLSGGLKGLKDEISVLKPFLNKLYEYRGKNKLIKIARFTLNKITSSFTSHDIVLVLKKMKPTVILNQ